MNIKHSALERMINNNSFSNSGKIRFKYYGDFEEMKYIYDDCKYDIRYIGNSNKDAAPIFEYNYRKISKENLLDFKKLSISLRQIKIKHYANMEMDENEKSMFTFFKFFMNACENLQVKAAVFNELNNNYLYNYED